MLMMTPKLRERYCKDCNIPIRVYDDPYFTDRLYLLDEYYNTLALWNRFAMSTNGFNTEEDYFHEYNRVKDEAINYIKSREGYATFQMADMQNEFSVNPAYRQLPSKDIFHSQNDRHVFVSIDMKKANFSALRQFDMTIFDGAKSWEEFLSKFTDVEHILYSKYIRQVILGNCDAKRQVSYEKHLMSELLDDIIADGVFSLDQVAFFSNDEIVFEFDDKTDADQIRKYLKAVVEGPQLLCPYMVPFRVEIFTLYKLEGTHGYYREIVNEDHTKQIDFKCLSSYELPFVIRKMRGEEVTENDKVFVFEGHLAKLID